MMTENHRSSVDKDTGLRFYIILLVCGWTLVVFFSTWFRIDQESRTRHTLSREIARSHLEKDLLLRDWNIKHGFVYAEVTPEHQPNPHLNLPERDITTPSGKTLTAINSSAMIRQLYELAAKKLSYSGRLTSLTPIRPENAPDPWERQALLQLAQGAGEINEIVDNNGEPQFRLLHPLKAGEKCLTCHNNFGYTVGQVIGGISLTLPLSAIDLAWQKNRLTILSVHVFLWLVGLWGIVWGGRKLQERIDAKQEIETELQQSQEKYKLLVNNIPTLVYQGYADGRVDFVDDKVEKMTGYSQEEFSQGSVLWPEVIVPEDLAACKRIFLRALKADGSYRREYRIKRKDGEIIWVAERSQIVLDVNGRIDFVSGVVLDITLQKELENSLKESERFWKTLLEAVGVGVMLTDAMNGRVTQVNAQAGAMLGYSGKEIIGQPRELFIRGAQDEAPPTRRTAVETENRFQGHLVRADGGLTPVWRMVAPVHIEGIEYLLETFLDITEQRRAEQALTQANQKLQAMIAEIGQTNKEINLLGRMVELLQICQTPDEAYEIIAQCGRALFPELSGALYILNDSNNLLTAACQWGDTLETDQIFNPNDCWALRQGRLYLSGATSLTGMNPQCRHIATAGRGSYLCLPLTAQGETIGLLHLEDLHVAAEGPEGSEIPAAVLSGAPQKLAISLAEHISLSLANLKLRESLRHQAIRDSLTGLFNRRYLQETLAREIYRSQRRNTALGVIMLDVDHFKLFNDTYGHEAGDRLLAVLGRYLQNSIRAEDIACRYGGEEFTLILPEIVPEVLLERAEAIREGVKDLEVLYQGRALGEVTISLGLSYFPEHGAEAEALLQAADAALYEAKRRGRNRSVMYGSPHDEDAVRIKAA